MPKTRRERREHQLQCYLSGEARRPHTHTRTLRSSLEDASSTATTSTASTAICAQCKPVLSRYIEVFKGMVHQGSELKKRKTANPHPRRPNMVHYRDIKSQNDWLRENMFDTLGNYLYCCSCICAALGVCKARLTRQRNVKRLQSQKPIIHMTKEEVEGQRLGECYYA